MPHPLSKRAVVATPMSPDNNIVFIDRERARRNPREFKTPPPPVWGEEEDVPPAEEFYNPGKNPYRHKFDYLDTKTRRFLQRIKQQDIDEYHALKSER